MEPGGWPAYRPARVQLPVSAIVIFIANAIEIDFGIDGARAGERRRLGRLGLGSSDRRIDGDKATSLGKWAMLGAWRLRGRGSERLAFLGLAAPCAASSGEQTDALRLCESAILALSVRVGMTMCSTAPRRSSGRRSSLIRSSGASSCREGPFETTSPPRVT